MGLNVYTSILIINYLSKNDFGSLRMVGSISLVLGFLTGFGIESVMHRYSIDLLKNNLTRSLKKLFSILFTLRLTLVIFFVSTFWFFKSHIFELFNLSIEFQNIFFVILLYSILPTLEGLFGSVLISYLEDYKIKLISILRSCFKILFLIVAIRYDFKLNGVILAMFLSYIISLFLFSHFSYSKIRFWKGDLSEKYELPYKEMIKFGAFNYFSSVTGIFKQLAIDNFFVSAFLGASGVANYGYASQIVSYPRMLNPLNILRSPINTFFLKIYNKNPREKTLKEYFTFVNRIYFFISFPMFIGIGFLAKPITLFIFNPIYIDTLTIIYVLLSSFFVGDLVYTFSSLTFVLKRPDIDFYSNIFSIYNIVMNVLLLKFFGLLGIAFATGSTVILIYLYYISVFKVILGIKLKFPFGSLFRVFLNSLPFSIFLAYVSIRIDNILHIIIVILLSIVMFLLSSSLNRIFSKKEEGFINSMIGYKIWRF